MSRLLVALALLILTSAAALAHPLLQNSMWAVFAPDRVRLAANVTLREIAVAQGLEIGPDGSVEATALDPAAQRHADYLLGHLSLHAGDTALTGQLTKITPPVLLSGNPEETIFQYEFDYPLPAGRAMPATIAFRHEMLREWPYAPGQPWEITYAVRLKKSGSENVRIALFRPASTQEFATDWTPPPAPPTGTFGAYLHHGLIHILTGWDHLLFVTALVLVTTTFWEMFKVILAFTLAHTLTLAISVLTDFRLPEHFVEPVIAGSIVLVALENFLRPNQTHGWMRLAVAFGFGLIHGLGFAGGLRDTLSELGTSQIVMALVAFSLGVEIGHQIVVLPTFALLRLGGRNGAGNFRPLVLRYGSVLIALAGTYYLVHALQA